MDFQQKYNENKSVIETLLKNYLPQKDGHNDIIIEAMDYSLSAGGKRIRPIMMLEAFKLFSDKTSIVEPFITAIEMIHTYSLIHDDLPAMDNDHLRRGKPTCHIQYGENMAILAGDALLNYSFEVMNEACFQEGDTKAYLKGMQELGAAAGLKGMISGQVVDVLNENTAVSVELLDYINNNKTSKLLEASLVVGAIVAGATTEQVEKLRVVGNNIGLAFQIQDDILDVIGDDKILGKPTKSDLKNNKNTYVSLLGLEDAQHKMKELYGEAIVLLKEMNLESKTDFLVQLIEELAARNN